MNSVSQNQIRRFYIILSLLALAGWLIILADKYVLEGFFLEGRTLCIIKNISGYPCPSCGIRSGIGYLIKLDFYRAVVQNPLSVIVILGGVIIPVWIIRDLILKDISLYSFNRKTGAWLRKNPLIIVLLILLILVNWIWNFYKF